MLYISKTPKSVTVEDGKNTIAIEFKTEKLACYAEDHIRERAQRNSYLSGDMRRALDEAVVCFKGQMK